MLNWIAVWVGQLARRPGRRAAEPRNGGSTPISNPVAERRRTCTSSGEARSLQGLDIGFFFALARARRLRGRCSTARRSASSCARSASIREAARYAGMSVARTYVDDDGDRRRVRRARGRDRRARLGVPARRRPTSRRRRSASSRSPSPCSAATARSASFFSALLFGALLTGTSTRNLDATVFRPDLAEQPDADHPGARRALRRRGRARARGSGTRRRAAAGGARDRHGSASLARRRSRSGSTLPPARARDHARRAARARRASRSRCGGWTVAHGRAPASARPPSPPVCSAASLGAARRRTRAAANLGDAVVWSALDRGDARQRDAADVRRDRRALLRAERRRQHRPRGDDADRSVLRHLGLGRDRQLGARPR